MCVTARAKLNVGVCWCTGLLNRLFPEGENAAITPLAKEGGRQRCWEKAGRARERDMVKGGREDKTQLTWPITANEVRYEQRGMWGGGGGQ